MIKKLLLFFLISSTSFSQEFDSNAVFCPSLGASCYMFFDKPTASMAESVLSLNDFLLKSMVKEKTDQFYPDDKRNKKKITERFYSGGIGNYGSAQEKMFSTTREYFQIVEGLNLNNHLKKNLKDCVEESGQFILDQFPNRIEYLNSVDANPSSVIYQKIIDSLPKDQNIFSQLKTKQAKEKFIKYILLKDETNLFQYYCFKDQDDCPEQIEDPDNPFVCWHFTRYMFHKYRYDPYNYANPSYDKHYHLNPVDEKFRIPIRETWIKYPEVGNPGHAINAVYIGDAPLEDRNSSSGNTDDYFFFEPQNDSQIFMETKEVKGTQYYFLEVGANPLTANPAQGFNAPRVCHGWEKTDNSVKVIPLEKCIEWNSLF